MIQMVIRCNNAIVDRAIFTAERQQHSTTTPTSGPSTPSTLPAPKRSAPHSAASSPTTRLWPALRPQPGFRWNNPHDVDNAKQALPEDPVWPVLCGIVEPMLHYLNTADLLEPIYGLPVHD